MGKIHMSSERSAVKDFLAQMNSVLSSDHFNIDRDFFFQRVRDSDAPDDEYTNENTLLELGYDTSDVVEELKTLGLDHYSESIVDNVADGFEIFFVFGKVISGRDVYIKVRMKQRRNTQEEYVFCISFHFARRPITVYPYRRTQ